MGERDAGVAAGGLGRGDAGDDFVRHAGRFERGELFGEPGEDRRVAPFEPHDGPARAGSRIMRSLISVCDKIRPWPWRPRQTSSASARVRCEQLGSGEIVVEHDVGRAEAFGTAQRQAIRDRPDRRRRDRLCRRWICIQSPDSRRRLIRAICHNLR